MRCTSILGGHFDVHFSKVFSLVEFVGIDEGLEAVERSDGVGIVGIDEVVEMEQPC